MDCTEQNMAHAPFSHISGFVFSVAHPLANCKHLFVSGGIFVGFCRKPREWPPAGGIPRPIAVPHPRTATPFTPNFILPSAARSLLQRHKLYGYRRGGTFESPKVPKSDLGLRPKDPTLVGRNLRLSRADPMLCFGQPSPLQCILLSPQGLATLRGPHLPRPEGL